MIPSTETKSFVAMIGRPLQWVHPNVFKQVYELRSGEERIATFTFPKAFSRLARAESQEGCWTLEEQGFWKSRIVIKRCEEENPVATVLLKAFSNVITFTVDQRRVFRISTNFWHTEYSVSTDMGELLVSLKVKHFAKHAAEVELGRKSELLTEMPWLVFLLWYMAVTHERKAAAAG